MNSLAIRPELLPFVAMTLLAFGLWAVILQRQIVGPVCRRVVSWPPHDKPVDVAMGGRARTGETPVARVKGT